MKKHTCKNCNSIFEYCRGCLLSPIPYKDAGYCSKSCYEASKKVVEPVVEEVVEIISTEDTTPIEVEMEAIVEEETPIEFESEAIALEEVPTMETTTVTQPTIKNETYNAYKKKKKKHR